MGIKWDESWAEALALLFMIIGFVSSLLLFNPLLSYLSVALAGFVAGRVYYVKRYTEPIFPFVLIIVGFLIGYLIGGFWVNRIVVLVIFITMLVLSYYLHLKKILVIFKSESFIK
ncbi:hypothetical protein HZC32_01990 [Candidatus Woesearchaeota archaeon]|nr:hypothetical protein [Candidatus Woesearchaeota archaeon]